MCISPDHGPTPTFMFIAVRVIELRVFKKNMDKIVEVISPVVYVSSCFWIYRFIFNVFSTVSPKAAMKVENWDFLTYGYNAEAPLCTCTQYYRTV